MPSFYQDRLGTNIGRALKTDACLHYIHYIINCINVIYINCRPAPRWSDLPRLSVRKQNKTYVSLVYSSRACLGKLPEHPMRNLKLNSVATVDLSCCFLVLVFALPTGEALLPGCCGAEGRPSARRRCVLFISGTFLGNKKPQQQRFNAFQFVSIRFNSFNSFQFVSILVLAARVCLNRGV